MSYKISVVIPCYNVEKFVGRCIESVLNQTYKNFEIICVNDGSQDDTLKVIQKYEVEFGDKVLVLTPRKRGTEPCYIKVLELLMENIYSI